MLGRILAVWVACLAPGGAGDLAALARQAGASKNYAFTVTQVSGFASRSVEGKYQAGKPIHFETSEIEFFRQGAVLVYLDAGRWQRTRADAPTNPPGVRNAAARVLGLTVLPHEELAGLPQALADYKRAAGKEKGTVVFTGTYTKDALKKWAPAGWQSAVVDGMVEVVASGNVVRHYTVVLRMQSKQGNATTDVRYVRSVTLRDVGATRVEVPAQAAAALK